MTTCTELSDRMPDVALGRARWTPAEERHLAECADCRAEWAIVSAARRLTDTALVAPDPAVTTARVLERLRDARARSVRRMRVWTAAAGLAAAAAVALAVWTGRGPAGPSAAPLSPRAPAPIATAPAPVAPPADSTALATAPVPPRVELPLLELDSLPAEALDSMLRLLDEPLAHAGPDGPPLGDTGDQELERALAGLEG